MSNELVDITPEGSDVPVYLDPSPVEEPVDKPPFPPEELITLNAPRSQSPNGIWWELTVTNTGGSKWVKMNPQPSV